MRKQWWLRLILVLVWVPTLVVGIARSNGVSGDGIYYFAYLRSVVIDQDLNFSNELEQFRDNPHVARQLDSGVTTPAGLTPNLFSVGPAIVWSPLYLVAHIATGGDGFGYWEILSLTLSTALLALLGLFVSWRATILLLPAQLKQFRAESIALAAVISTYYGTNLVYYGTFETSMSHAAGFAVVSSLILLWLKWRERLMAWQWLILGLLSGLAGLMRWQLLAVGVVIIAVDLVSRKKLSAWKATLAAAIGSLISFSPQLIAWRILYGSWIVVPQGTGFFDLRSPHALETLVSARHGLLTWTPLVVLAFVGLILLWRRSKTLRPELVLLLIAFLVQVYINGAAIEWWGGEAFGARRYTDLSVIFVIGIAGLLYAAWHKRTLRWVALGAISILVVWNLLFMQAYRHDQISRAGYVSASDAVTGVLDLIK